jgi:hypothetical protein
MKFTRKQFIIAFFCTAVLGTAVLVFLASRKQKGAVAPKPIPVITTPQETKIESPRRLVLGLSVEGREIESYSFGSGPMQLAFIGGIHGGYEWNSVLLAYKFIDYLGENLKSIPKNLTIMVIPSMNPDGVFKITGKEGRFTASDIPAGSNAAGRLNAREVDLNRNFDCNWESKGVWQSKTVSGGTSPFSEPESAAIKKFVLENKPAAVIFWHSKSGTVYGSSCNNDMLDETTDIMNAYAAPTFDQYKVSGDASDWLASINIPAITAELKTHETTEWQQNLAGIQALFEYYKNK